MRAQFATLLADIGFVADATDAGAGHGRRQGAAQLADDVSRPWNAHATHPAVIKVRGHGVAVAQPEQENNPQMNLLFSFFFGSTFKQKVCLHLPCKPSFSSNARKDALCEDSPVSLQ